MLRLLLCDESAPARAALRALLATSHGLDIAGEAATADEAVALAAELRPDVVLLDVSASLVEGLDAIRRLDETSPRARIVALARFAKPETVMAAIEAGAAAFCSKGAPLWELERALTDEGRSRLRLVHARDAGPAADPLTGLPGRSAFETELARLLAGAGESGREVGVVLLDLDGFRTFNEVNGRAAGDEVLRRTAVALTRVVPAGEAAFRTGGDEFALTVAGGVAAARSLAERVRAALRLEARFGRFPTVSGGIASSPAEAGTGRRLVRRADAALYAAKWTGRNRVLVYAAAGEAASRTPRRPPRAERARVLLVDDDPGLRALLRTTLEPADLEVHEAGDAGEAERVLAGRGADVLVLDVHLPGLDGLTFARRLKDSPTTRDVAIVLLTGDESPDVAAAAAAAGADAFLRKPFGPLELLDLVERLAGGHGSLPLRAATEVEGGQLERFAHDLRRLLEIERGQRRLLQKAYRETVTALAMALETKDTGTKAHSQRVQRYAVALAEAIDPGLLGDPSLEYGFLLHDIGKIGIPDRILLKPGVLVEGERRLMQTHPVLGEQMLSNVALLQGEGLRVVRSHHERWDGGGYPDGLAGREIPLGARIFAVADTLDAMTSDRPYRRALPWAEAVAEIRREASRQFDPEVVRAFEEREPVLRVVRTRLAAA